jgi:integrase
MPRTPHRQSVDRLSDPDRATLLRAFAMRSADADLAYRVTRFIFSTGAHPAVLSDPARWNLRIEGAMLTWHRPKTDQEVNVPIDPAIEGWLPAFIDQLEVEHRHPVFVNRLVHRFGEQTGLPDITPRTLRHDYSYRALESQGLLAARALTGTTTRTLLGYSGSKASKVAAQQAADNPKGLFG